MTRTVDRMGDGRRVSRMDASDRVGDRSIAQVSAGDRFDRASAVAEIDRLAPGLLDRFRYRRAHADTLHLMLETARAAASARVDASGAPAPAPTPAPIPTAPASTVSRQAREQMVARNRGLAK